MGAPIRRKVPEKNFGRALLFFGYKSTYSRFGERFSDGEYSLVSFLFCCSTHGALVPYRVGATAYMYNALMSLSLLHI